MIRRIFSTPGRQAAAWAGIGILGLGLAAIGLVLYNRHGTTGSSQRADAVGTTSATATATPSTVASATPTATPSPTVTPTPSPTARPQGNANPGGNVNPAPAESVPTATPTLPPVVAGGPYCSNISSTSPPNSVIGLLTSGGNAVPAGASVTLLFDGVAGPSATTAAAGGYRLDYGAGGSDCANRVGAGIAVVYGGAVFATGHTVGDSPGGPVRVDIAAP